MADASAAAMSRAVRMAVPDGASAFLSWWSSVISTWGMKCAAFSANCIMSTAPMAKLGAKNRHVPSGASLASSASASSDSPVVPTTQSTPAASAMCRLDSTTVGRYQCPFTEPGNYTVRVTVKNNLGGVIYAVTKRVTVVTPQALYSSIVSIYSGVTDRLKAGNIDGALNAFTGTVREKYRAAFTEIGSGLPALVNGFGVISGASINEKFGELIVVKTTTQGEVATPVILMLGVDGIWRIDGF